MNDRAETVPTVTCDPSGMGWEQCTAAGWEKAQLIVWMRLPLRRKLEAVEEMCNLSRRFVAARQRAGLPYFDPATREPVQPRNAEFSQENLQIPLAPNAPLAHSNPSKSRGGAAW